MFIKNNKKEEDRNRCPLECSFIAFVIAYSFKEKKRETPKISNRKSAVLSTLQ